MKTVSILSSLFWDCQHEDSLHSQFTILRLSTWRESPFSISHSQTVHMKIVSILNSTFSDLDMKIVSILNSPFSDCLHADSLYSQFAILRLPTWRLSPFSTCHSQTAYMKIVSILHLPFSDCPGENSFHSQFAILRPRHEDSLHSQFAILRLPMWR